MRRPSSIEPFTPSPTVTLHPALQAALDNLDVQIDEELNRYRRQRRNPNLTPRRQPFPSPASQSADGILRDNIQLPSPRSSIYADQSRSNPLPQSSHSVHQYQTSVDHYDHQTRANVQLNRQTAQRITDQRTTQPSGSAYATAATVMAASASTAPVSLTPVSPTPVSPTLGPSQQFVPAPEASRISSYAEQHDLSAYAPHPALQKLVQQPVNASLYAAQQAVQAAASEDHRSSYLTSSEELLRSIAEEEPMRTEPASHSLLDTLLTPLGVGSMLLLLLSSTTLGYVIMNPSSLGLWTSDQDSATQTSPTAPAGQNAGSGEAPSPNLAADEFIDLGIDTLSRIPKQPIRTTASPSPAAKGQAKTDKANAAKPSSTSSQPNVIAPEATAPAPEYIPAPEPLPSLSTVVVPATPPVMSVPVPAPEPPASVPAPVSPEPISTVPPSIVTVPPPVATAPLPQVDQVDQSEPPANHSASQPAADPHYYVVTDYSGDASLEQARGAIPDAYVRNLPSQGAKVQLGAFSDEAKAQELLQELQQQGIEAEVYHP